MSELHISQRFHVQLGRMWQKGLHNFSLHKVNRQRKFCIIIIGAAKVFIFKVIFIISCTSLNSMQAKTGQGQGSRDEAEHCTNSAKLVKFAQQGQFTSSLVSL